MATVRNDSYDVVVIGAGIVGSMVARELSKYQLSVAVIDKESDVGMGQSTSNSAIIHSGHDPQPGTDKARYNVRGNSLWFEIARDLEIPIERTGAMIVAVDEEEHSGIEPLAERGRANGVPVEVFSREEALEKEPLLSPDVTGALWTPTAGIVDPFQGVVGAAENAAENGVEFILNTAITDAIIEDGRLVALETSNGRIGTTICINAAGVHSDDIMRMFGVRPEFEITARRGEYFVFDQSALSVGTVLFPMPSEKGKGILVTHTTHGNTMVGPNSDYISDKEDHATTEKGMQTILAGAQRLVPAISSRDVIATFAGLRATGNYKPVPGHGRDFLIERSIEVEGLINLAGVESPGYVSAPAIAERAAELVGEAGITLEKKKDWKRTRRAIPRFHHLSHEQRVELIRENPAFGRIVCRCEEVTEGEILRAIHSPIPATNYDAIKRRTWLGTGRCQGSFDYPRTMEILARELGLSMTEITKKGPGSVFLYRKTKEEVV